MTKILGQRNISELRRERTSYFASRSIVEKRSKLGKNSSYFPYKCIHEQQYAERQESLGVPFEYEAKAFEINLDGKIRRWIPDFYLPNTDEFIEIDCGQNPRKRKKILAFSNQYPFVKLVILPRPNHKVKDKWYENKDL